MGTVLDIRCILAVVGYVAAIAHRPLPSLFVMLLFYYCMFHPQPFSQVNVDDGVDVIVTLLFSVGSCGMGVPVAGLGKSWAKLIDVWHWVSMLGQGGTLDMCMYIYSVYQRSLCKVLSHNTYQWVQRKMAWSLYQLWTGKWSTHDDLGNPFLEDRMFMLRPPVLCC